jgi:hypothetical protein
MKAHGTQSRALAALGLLGLLSLTGCGAGLPTSPVVDPSRGTVGPGMSSMALDAGDDYSPPAGGGTWTSGDTLALQVMGQGGHGHAHGQGLGKKPKKH